MFVDEAVCWTDNNAIQVDIKLVACGYLSSQILVCFVQVVCRLKRERDVFRELSLRCTHQQRNEFLILILPYLVRGS